MPSGIQATHDCGKDNDLASQNSTDLRSAFPIALAGLRLSSSILEADRGGVCLAAGHSWTQYVNPAVHPLDHRYRGGRKPAEGFNLVGAGASRADPGQRGVELF